MAEWLSWCCHGWVFGEKTSRSSAAPRARSDALRVGHGHASLRDVTRSPLGGKGGLADRMESFWIAETLKYLYLVQDPDHPIDLLKYTFNTEAHPLSVLGESGNHISDVLSSGG